MRRAIALFAVLLTAALAWAAPPQTGSSTTPVPSTPQKQEVAVFAGGCFWCMQPAFDKVPGVISTLVGYTGGHTQNPRYEDVETGDTGHAESIRVLYDPTQVSYSQLLDVFWHNVDPLAKDRQFCDSGNQYRSAIFYVSDYQKKLAELSKQKVQARFKDPVQTQIVPASPFYAAEDYHQKYYEKNPVRYHFYRWNCGRDDRLKELWGKDAPAEH